MVIVLFRFPLKCFVRRRDANTTFVIIKHSFMIRTVLCYLVPILQSSEASPFTKPRELFLFTSRAFVLAYFYFAVISSNEFLFNNWGVSAKAVYYMVHLHLPCPDFGKDTFGSGFSGFVVGGITPNMEIATIIRTRI